MTRFVILRHDLPPNAARPSHWDLMFEDAGALKTWALEQLPTPGLAVPAQPLPDHRLAYLDYEGTVSGNRGTVTRWDSGTVRWITRTQDQWRGRWAGAKLIGQFQLSRSTAIPEHWTLEYWPESVRTVP